MNSREPSTDRQVSEDRLRRVLKGQYHAALAMLHQAIDLCPPDAWSDSRPVNSVWQIAYHTLFFTHLYMQPNEAAFEPWEDHQWNVQYPDGIPGPPDTESSLPLVSDPYTKDQVLEYWSVCDRMVDEMVDILDLKSLDSGFSWYDVSKLEHQLINIRHIQHGAAQIADRVRAAADVGVDWVSSKQREET